MKPSRLLWVSLFMTGVFSLGHPSGHADWKIVSHNYPPVEYTIGTPADTYWAPWLMPVVQSFMRLKLGIRLSGGSLEIKNPIKVSVEYDTAQAKGGKTMRLRFRAQPISPSHNTFESAFAFQLPNKIQLGLINVAGIGSLLPWIDIPYDFWDLIAVVPKVGSQISSAAQNIGVNMSSKEALPLGGSKTFHDVRDLVSFNMLEAYLAKADKTALGTKLANKIPGKAGILTAIMTFTGKNSEVATNILTEACASAALALPGKVGSIVIRADPSFTIEGVRAGLSVRYFVEGASGGIKGSGAYPLYFNSPDQIQEIYFGVTPFINEGDKLKIIVDKIHYEFKLTQKLQFLLGLSLIPGPAEEYTKFLTHRQVTKDVTSEHTFVIDLTPSEEAIQNLYINPGCTSAQVLFASNKIALKSTVDVYKPGTLAVPANRVKRVSENDFKHSHNIMITDLQPDTEYVFLISAVDTAGVNYASSYEQESGKSFGTRSAKTLKECPERVMDSAVGDFKFVGTPGVMAGHNNADGYYIDFAWKTTQNSSTSVYYSPSPDISINYVAAVKHRNGVVTQGWVTSEDSTFEIVKDHSMRLRQLDPGTQYYYNIRSWRYAKEDTVEEPLYAIGKFGSITTPAPPPPPTLKIKVQESGTNAAVRDVPVLVTKTNDSNFLLVLPTGASGLTSMINLDKNSTYIFSVKDHEGYQDIASSPMLISSSASGEFNPPVLSLVRRISPGGFVYDVTGQPVSGATVTCGSQTVQSNNQGHYKFENLSAGTPTVNIAKDGFISTSVKGLVSSYKLFSAPPAVLVSKTAVLNISVKEGAGAGVNQAALSVKTGSTVLGPEVRTNASGQATFSCAFNDVQPREVTVTAVPVATSNLSTRTETVTMAAGTSSKLDLILDRDVSAPAVGDVRIRQVHPGKFEITFKTNKEGVSAMVEFRAPNGNLSHDAWTPGVSAASSGITQHSHVKEWQSMPAGTAQVNIKVKDRAGNESSTGFSDFLIFGGESWNLRVEDITFNSCVLKWNPYPYPEGFAKYVIRGSGFPTVEVTNRNTASYSVKNLPEGTGYSIAVTALDPSGQELARPMGAEFKLLVRPKPPVVSADPMTLIADSVPLNREVFPYFNVSDPDSPIDSITVILLGGSQKKTVLLDQKGYNKDKVTNEHNKCGFTPTKPGKYTILVTAVDVTGLSGELRKEFTVQGSEVPQIAFSGKPSPSPWTAGIESSRKIEILNYNKLEGEVTSRIDWGDTTKEEAVHPAIGRYQSFSHTYKAPGEYALSVTLAVQSDGQEVPRTVRETVIVTGAPPAVSLTRDTARGQANEQQFRIKATAGSYAVKSWELDYGDGQKSSGKGGVDDAVLHVYKNQTGKIKDPVTQKVIREVPPYKAVFTVTDAGGAQLKKELSVSIARDAAVTSGATGESSKLQASEPTSGNAPRKR